LPHLPKGIPGAKQGCNPESTPLIHKRVSEARLTPVVTERNDRPLPNLSPADIDVLEDGHPIPDFELRPAGDVPLRVGSCST